jgi:transketolase
MEFAFLHDWNVILVPDGKDFQQILAAQRAVAAMDNSQPTAIVYRTTKGWQYGIEGKASHGAGHKLCSDGFYEALEPLSEITDLELPRCQADNQRCEAGQKEEVVEGCFWEALQAIRRVMENRHPMIDALAAGLRNAQDRLNGRKRRPRSNAPSLKAVFDTATQAGNSIPAELKLTPG